MTDGQDAVSLQETARILIVDDNRAIHEDFRKILRGRDLDDNLRNLEATLFGAVPEGGASQPAAFRVDSAYQGAEALTLVLRAIKERQPYCVAFIDMRMPAWRPSSACGLPTPRSRSSSARRIRITIGKS
jgi:diguanylate cyclase